MFETRDNSNKSSLLLPVNSTEFAFNPLEALTYWTSDVMLTCLTSSRLSAVSVNNFFIYVSALIRLFPLRVKRPSITPTDPHKIKPTTA